MNNTNRCGSRSSRRRMSERASMDTLRMRGATALFMMLLSVCWGVIGGEDAYVVGVTLERVAAGQALAQQNA